MINKIQVMYALKRCIYNAPDACKDCSYYNTGTFAGTIGLGCADNLMADALALLKGEGEVKPIRSKDADVWYCGNCDAIVGEETLTIGGIQEVRHNYCPECGRKVKWG